MEQQVVDLATGNFNIGLFRLNALVAVCLLQAWFMWNFIMFHIKRMREAKAKEKPDMFWNYKCSEFLFNSLFAISTVWWSVGNIHPEQDASSYSALFETYTNYSMSIHRFITCVLCEGKEGAGGGEGHRSAWGWPGYQEVSPPEGVSQVKPDPGAPQQLSLHGPAVYHQVPHHMFKYFYIDGFAFIFCCCDVSSVLYYVVTTPWRCNKIFI